MLLPLSKTFERNALELLTAAAAIDAVVAEWDTLGERALVAGATGVEELGSKGNGSSGESGLVGIMSEDREGSMAVEKTGSEGLSSEETVD
jgi:hypothetical protein